MTIHDPAADQHFDFPVDGSAAANRMQPYSPKERVHPAPGLIGAENFHAAFDQEVERRQIEQQLAQDGNTKVHHFTNGRNPEIVRMVDATKTPVAHYAVGENGELEALPMPDRRDPDYDWSLGVPQFVEDLEAAVESTDLSDTDGRTASQIAAELLKHPALHGYLEIGEIAPEDHAVYNTGEGAQQQFERYADPVLLDGAESEDGEHYGVETEQEWIGNVPAVAQEPSGLTGMEWDVPAAEEICFPAPLKLTDYDAVTAEGAEKQWIKHRRPQLMAIAKAGLDAIQELSGMQAELKGFHEDRPVEAGPALQHWQGNKLMLIVSEAVEAHDEIRAGQNAWDTYYPTWNEEVSAEPIPGQHKPEGVPSEIADVIVRAADFAWTEGFDLSQIVIEKLEYNNTRPHKHGKGF